MTGEERSSERMMEEEGGRGKRFRETESEKKGRERSTGEEELERN